MPPKFFYIFNTCPYWHSKFMEVCFCVTYPLFDEDDEEQSVNLSSEPWDVPNTAVIERNKDFFLYGKPDENV